jgi:hypothetical protein
MAKRKKPPELTFQEHVADVLARQHEYGVLEQSDITDHEHFIAEDQLWAFLTPHRATRSASSRTTTERTRGTKCSAPCAKNWHCEPFDCAEVAVAANQRGVLVRVGDNPLGAAVSRC